VAGSLARAGALAAVCDVDEFARSRARVDHPDALVTGDLDSAFEACDSVWVATPADSHFQVAVAALSAGRHVLVEKPACRSTVEAEYLCRLAEVRRLTVMPGHLSCYADGAGTPPSGSPVILVRHTPSRGPGDRDVLWDLAVHDVALAYRWYGARMEDLVATGDADTVTASWHTRAGVHVLLSASWRAPTKVRAVASPAGWREERWRPGDTPAPLDVEAGQFRRAMADVSARLDMAAELEHVTHMVELIARARG